VIVSFGLDTLAATLAEIRVERPFLVASERWSALAGGLPHVAWWTEVPSGRVEVPPEADGILALGGGSAIDTGKLASARSGLPLLSIPTTYSGAEWTTFYGIRTPDRRLQAGGTGALPAAIVYDVDLTLDLPRTDSGGTALNALAHCAEALYVRGRSAEGDEAALAGAAAIAQSLPVVLADPDAREARELLLRGAADAGRALSLAGLGLAHALAQALGGAYGLSHGAMNALCLPPALEFNRGLVPEPVARFGRAIGADAVDGTRALARLAGFERLRDFGVPQGDLGRIAAVAAGRGGNLANPRPATVEEIGALLDSIW